MGDFFFWRIPGPNASSIFGVASMADFFFFFGESRARRKESPDGSLKKKKSAFWRRRIYYYTSHRQLTRLEFICRFLARFCCVKKLGDYCNSYWMRCYFIWAAETEIFLQPYITRIVRTFLTSATAAKKNIRLRLCPLLGLSLSVQRFCNQ